MRPPKPLRVLPGRLVSPLCAGQPNDPTRPMTSLKTVWTNIKEKAGIKGRWHDRRHTLVTELAESGAGDQTIMDIAGHVSRQMLARYRRIRMKAKRKVLESIVSKPAPAPQAASPNRSFSQRPRPKRSSSPQN